MKIFHLFTILFWLFQFQSELQFVLGKIVQLELRSTGSLRTRLVKENRWRDTVDGIRNDLAVGGQPFLDYFDGYYLFNISIGTPPQNFTIAIDTGNSYFWVIDAERCLQVACRGHKLSRYLKRGFNSSLSTTSKLENRRFVVEYRSGNVSGGYVNDCIRLGDLQIVGPIGIAMEVPHIIALQPFDGAMGFAWPYFTRERTKSPIFGMLQQMDEPIFTVWIDRRRPVWMGGSGGLVTFGGRDEKNCVPEWNYVPLSSRSLWQFYIQEFQIGKYRSWRRRIAIADTGTSLLGGPYGQFSIIISEVGARYSVEDDFYTVNCDSLRNLSDIVFVIENVKYRIPPIDYVLNMQNGICVLGIFGMFASGFGVDWILGDTFLDSYCNLYDIGNGRMGFAKARDATEK